MKGDTKTKQQLLVEIEERLDSAEQRLKEANELLQSEITERKRAEETFVQAQKYAENGILILDAGTGQISNVNPFLIEMLGYSHDQFLGKRLWEIGAFKDIQEAKTTFSELQTKGYVRYEDLPLQTKDGRLIDVEFVSNVYLVDHKKVIQCNIRDITRRKQLEEELRKSYDELEVRIQERTAELAQRNEELTVEIDERLKMEQALRESKEQLRILAAQVLSAQENERKRIALEIHDVLGSNLSAIKFKAEEALQHLPKYNETLNISKPLETLIPLIQETIGETRRIQADLRPPLLDDLGIVATLTWFCRRFKTIYSGIEVEPVITIREEEVPDHLKIVLFRITQEAMNNIGKHAKADSVHFGLRKIDGAIELYIKDNGEGFDSENLSSREISTKGLGLSSMKERTEFLKGSFYIESDKGKGTVIRAVWPA